MNHLGTVVLETQRLTLRPFTMEDAEASYRNWMSDEKVTEFLCWSAHKDIAETRESLGKWIKAYQYPSFYQWAIVPKESGEPIGSISVVSMDEKLHMVHIGYCIGREWWHQGYTREALMRIISFFFDEVKTKRIESQHDPNNPNSGKVMKKCGMTHEGTLRRADWSNRGIVDACMYSILAEDYYGKKGNA